MPNMRVKMAVGTRYKRLVCLEEVGVINKHNCFRFKCDCGNIITATGSSVKNGNKGSCGCLSRENIKTMNLKHNGSYKSEYAIWSSLKQRCYYIKSDQYHNYGGRGITVCERWLNSFEHFYSDMGPRPSPKHSIDRIDNNGNYSPDNCKWATKKEQSRNRRTNVRFLYNGNDYILNEFSELVGMTPGSISYHLKRGKTIEEILSLLKEKQTVSFHGKLFTISSFAKYINISAGSVRKLIKDKGYSPEEVIKYFNLSRHITFEGIKYSVNEFSKLIGISREKLKYWYNRGDSVQRMLDLAKELGATIDLDFKKDHVSNNPIVLM